MACTNTFVQAVYICKPGADTGFRLRGGQKRAELANVMGGSGGKPPEIFLTLGGQISMYSNSSILKFSPLSNLNGNSKLMLEYSSQIKE